MTILYLKNRDEVVHSCLETKKPCIGFLLIEVFSIIRIRIFTLPALCVFKFPGRSAPIVDPGYGSRRRAASAAVHATAAAVAALDEDEAYADPSVRDVGATDLASTQFALEPFVPGLVEAAKEPQAPGKPLTLNAIGPALVGRIAEVFWPDDKNPADSLWYLVKIESVNMAAQTASIRYQNGEMEEALSLADVAKEGHMLLINQSRLH